MMKKADINTKKHKLVLRALIIVGAVLLLFFWIRHVQKSKISIDDIKANNIPDYTITTQFSTTNATITVGNDSEEYMLYGEAPSATQTQTDNSRTTQKNYLPSVVPDLGIVYLKGEFSQKTYKNVGENRQITCYDTSSFLVDIYDINSPETLLKSWDVKEILGDSYSIVEVDPYIKNVDFEWVFYGENYDKTISESPYLFLSVIQNSLKENSTPKVFPIYINLNTGEIERTNSSDEMENAYWGMRQENINFLKIPSENIPFTVQGNSASKVFLPLAIRIKVL